MRVREESREKDESQWLFFAIYGVPLVRIRRAKNESSSHRRGLRVGTKKCRISPRIQEKNLGEIEVLGLGSAHEAS